MKKLKPMTGLIIAVGSLAGAAGGWALLSQDSNRVETIAIPTPAATAPSVQPTSEPAPTLEAPTGNQPQRPSRGQPGSSSSTQPRLRSGGS